ncbi:MAG: hypothetical protein V8T12_00765 [Parabacteroides johnsonii]
MELPWFNNYARKKKDSLVNYETDQLIIVKGKDFSYTFCKKSGALSSIVLKGKELLKSPLKFNLWRAPLANEVDGWNARNAQQ